MHEIAQRLRQLTSRLLTPQATPQAPVASVISFVAFVERASTLSSDALAVLQECGIEPTMVIPLTNKPCWELTMRTRVLQFMLEHGDGGFAVIVTNRTIQTIADLLTLRHQFRVHVVNHRLWTSQVLSLAVAIAPRQASVKTPAVGVFWDIENIGRTDRAVEIIRDIQLEFGPVTRAIAAAASIDPSFASGNLIKAGVTLMNEWNGQPRQEVADEVLIHQMFHFCETTPPPATIVLISNDQDFIRPCSVLFNRGYVVIRIVCPNPNWPARQWRIVDYISEFRLVDAIHTSGRSLAQAAQAAPVPAATPQVLPPPYSSGINAMQDEPHTPLQFLRSSSGSAAFPETMLLEGADSDDDDAALILRDNLLEVYTVRLLQLIKSNVKPTVHPEDGSTLVRVIDRQVLEALWLSKGMPYSRAIMDQLLRKAEEIGFIEFSLDPENADIFAFEDLLESILSEKGAESIAAAVESEHYDCASTPDQSERASFATKGSIAIQRNDLSDPVSLWAPLVVRNTSGIVGDCLRHIYNLLMRSQKSLKWDSVASSLETALSVKADGAEVSDARRIATEKCAENKENAIAFFSNGPKGGMITIHPWISRSFLKKLNAVSLQPRDTIGAAAPAARAPRQIPVAELREVRVEGLMVPFEQLEQTAGIDYFRNHPDVSLKYCQRPNCPNMAQCTFAHRRHDQPTPAPLPRGQRIEVDLTEADRILGDVISELCSTSPDRRCLVNMVGIPFWDRMRRPAQKGFVKELIEKGEVAGRWKIIKVRPTTAGGTEVWWVQMLLREEVQFVN